MLGKAPYISDNPFRQLAMPASLPFRALSKQAQAAEKKRQVGISDPAALEAEFGGITEETNSVIARMAANPSDRILFRILWPHTDWGVELLVEGGRIGSEGRDAVDIQHVEFLDSWIGFLRSGAEPDLETALSAWDLLQSIGFAERLAAIEGDDDRIELPAAVDRVKAVFPRATEVLLTQAVSKARDQWRSEQIEPALDILAVVLASPLDDMAEARALSPIIEEGDAMAQAIEEWGGDEFTRREAIDPIAGLALLIKVIGSRHPAVDRWEDLLYQYGVHPNDYMRAPQPYPEPPPVQFPVAAQPTEPPPKGWQRIALPMGCLLCLVLLAIPSLFPAQVYKLYTLIGLAPEPEQEPPPSINYEWRDPAYTGFQTPEVRDERKRLTAEIKQLEKKYSPLQSFILDDDGDALDKERKILEKKPSRPSSSEVRAYNRKVDAFNKKLKAHKAAVAEYNKWVELVNAKQDKLDKLGGPLE